MDRQSTARPHHREPQRAASALVHSAVEPNVFARIEADTTVKPATLKATWINRAGERIFEVATTSTQLGHRH